MSMEPIEDISILVAEDETQLLRYTADYLSLFFGHVHMAKDGKEAWEIYQKEKPDIMLVDLHMPKVDGLSFIKQVREKDKNTQIIITTAYSEQDVLLQAIELHLVKYLIKPVQHDMLKELLFSLVEKIRQKRALITLKKPYYWDKEEKRLFHRKEEIGLNPKERKVLDLLVRHHNRIISAIDIYNTIYEDDPNKEFSAHAVTSLIKRLRQKLPKEIIQSVYGQGYQLIIT